MNLSTPPQKPESRLRKEWRSFIEQVIRLGNCFLNRSFDLTIKGSQRRNLILTILFLALGFLFSFRAYTIGEWGEQLRLFFQHLLNPNITQSTPDNIFDFFTFTFKAVFAPLNLRILAILALPFVVALQFAAIYLADIFEIKIEIAREFILQVALTGSRNSIRIGKGEIAEKDKNSPIFLIGGPGQVIVELDSAALFEKPNGQPNVIGPTVKGKAKLEGFERFRQAIDLRDQHTDPLVVDGRSLDGVPVSTADVRMVFSISRGKKQPSAKQPYRYDKEAIKSLVYRQTSRVSLDGQHPSEPPSSWTGTIQGLIRSKLGGFMSKHRLADFLASIGQPEIDRARQREEEIVRAGEEVISSDDELKPRFVPPPPDFQPRHVVSNLFSEFAEGFTSDASHREVELSWIGVGIWKTPNEIVPSKHLEAWRLSRENIIRGSKGAMEGLRQDVYLQQILRMIQNIPLERYQLHSEEAHKDIVQELLIAYREQLIETIVLLEKSDREVPKSIRSAIKHIEEVMGIKHWVGR